jgi:formate/nitrite transporter FocA (FNT family)
VLTGRAGGWRDPGTDLGPLRASAARKLSAFALSPGRFVTSAYLAGVAIAFVYMAAIAVRVRVAAIAPGAEDLAAPAVVALGLSVAVLLARLDLSVGTGALLAICRLERQGRSNPCAAAVVVCAAANLLGSASVAALMAHAGLLEGLLPTLAELSARRMAVPARQLLLQGLLGGWWLGLVVLVAALAREPRWRTAVIGGGLFLFVASGFRLASADAALNVPVWVGPAAPGLGGRHLLALLAWVSAGNLVGAAVLGGGLLWLATGEPRQERPGSPAPKRGATPGPAAVRMRPAIARPAGVVRVPWRSPR